MQTMCRFARVVRASSVFGSLDLEPSPYFSKNGYFRRRRMADRPSPGCKAVERMFSCSSWTFPFQNLGLLRVWLVRKFLGADRCCSSMKHFVDVFQQTIFIITGSNTSKVVTFWN